MLLYALIARSSDGCILVEATKRGVQGNHTQIANELLNKLTSNPHLVSVGNRKTFTNSSIVGYNQNSNPWGGDGDIEMKNMWNGLDVEEDYGDTHSQASKLSKASSLNFSFSKNKKKKKRPQNDESSTEDNEHFSKVPHFFHVQRGESVLYIALSDDTTAQNHRINFSFLLDVEKEFSRRYTPNKILKANAYGMEKAFNKTLSNMMHHCNTNRDSLGRDTKISQLNAEVESMKKVLGLNIQLMMKNEYMFEQLQEDTEELLIDAKVFSKRGKKVKRAMKRKKHMYTCILIMFTLLLIYLMMARLCGLGLSCEAEDFGFSSGDDDDGNNNNAQNYGYNNDDAKENNANQYYHDNGGDNNAGAGGGER